jgi:hypothetical protein
MSKAIFHVSDLSGLGTLNTELRLCLAFVNQIVNEQCNVVDLLKHLESDRACVVSAYDKLIDTVKSFRANKESCNV